MACSLPVFCYLLMWLTNIKSEELCKKVSKVVSEKADYYVTGLFPVYNTAPSRYNVNGLQYSEIVKYTLKEANKKSPYKIGYEFYDTCGEAQLDITTHIVFDMLLGDSSYYWRGGSTSEHKHSPDTCHCQTESYPSRRIGIVGPASSSVSARTSNYMANEDIELISYASTSPSLSDKLDYPNFMRTIPSDTYQVQVIVDLILHFNWTYVSIVASDNPYGRAGRDELLEYFKQQDVCVGIQISFGVPYDDEEIEKVVKHLVARPKAEVIVLFALSTPSKMIFDYATKFQLYHRTWILTEAVTGRGQWIRNIKPAVLTGAFGITPFAGTDANFEEHFWDLSYADASNNPFLKTFFHIKGINSSNSDNITLANFKPNFNGDKVGNARNAIITFIVALQSFIKDTCETSNCSVWPSLSNRTYFNRNYVKQATFKGLLDETVSFDENGDITTTTYMIQNMQKKNDSQVLFIVGEWTPGKRLVIDTTKVTWATRVKPKSLCSEPCKPGYYTVYDKSKLCCWDCVICPKGLVKTGYGHGNCTLCDENSVSYNGEKCVKLDEIAVGLVSVTGGVMLTLSAFGIMTGSIVLYTFVKHRNSVVIRTGNTKFSTIQIIAQLVLFLSLLLMLMEITTETCAIQLYLIGVLLVIIFSIILIKTEILLRIFNAKLRINKTYARITTSLQFCIVVSATSIFSLIQFILHLQNPIHIKEIINFEKRNKHIICDFNTHMTATMLYLIFLSLVCAFQAFRARKLPDLFNEGNFIMYSVFVSSVNMAVVIFLTHYAEGAESKIFITFIFIFSTNFFLLTIMFGNRIWIIWFKGGRNTERGKALTFDNTMKATWLVIRPTERPVFASDSPVESFSLET